MGGGGTPLSRKSTEDVAALVEVKFVGMGVHDILKMTEAVPVDGVSGVYLCPIQYPMGSKQRTRVEAVVSSVMI